jgi:hypothetical protein
MPKENTHLMFAHEVLDHCSDARLLRDACAHMDHYRLGSFIPDTFFYASTKPLKEISEVLHGKDGAPTNEAILDVLDQGCGPFDLAFALGYLTHCALDIVFHPVINALAGDYYDSDPEKRRSSVYLHRHLETSLDARTGNTARIHRLARPGLVKGLAYERFIRRRFSAPQGSLKTALSRQLLLNRFFESAAAYAAARILSRLGASGAYETLALFYPNLRRDTTRITETITFFDPGTSAERQVTLRELFSRARNKALGMMTAAAGYARGEISRQDLIEAVPGENLSTGEVPGRPG